MVFVTSISKIRFTRYHGLHSPTQAQPRIPLHPDSTRGPGTQPGTSKAALGPGPVRETEALSKPVRGDAYPATLVRTLAVSHPTPQGRSSSPAQLRSPPWQPRAPRARMTWISCQCQRQRKEEKKKKKNLNF